MSDNTTTSAGRNLMVLKASAGSGKTYNLALQYIKHLLFTTDGHGHLVPRRGRGDDRILNAHRLLLAITFTNKATDEMKERIIRELYALSRPGADSDYLAIFMAETGLDEGAVRQLARQALDELLFDYSNFNVSTIDSFFQTILRNFARELDRDFNYDIQLEETYAVKVAIHNFLLSLGQEGKPTAVDQWVKEYQSHLVHGDPDKKSWRFFDDGGAFLDFAKQINTEVFRAKMDEIRAYLRRDDGEGGYENDFSRIRGFKRFLHQVIEAAAGDNEAAHTEFLDTLQPLEGSLGGRSKFKNILAEPDKIDEKLDKFDLDKIAGQFSKNLVPDEAVLGQLASQIRRMERCRLIIKFFKAMERDSGLLGLLAMIDQYLERFRHESNSILIGDTNELIGAVLESGSEFVYERVGTSIAHYMIDEFQDTSTKQYENFSGLLHESLASGHFNMLIGDAKQSIYRFRNADPSVFREKVDRDFAADIYLPKVEPGKPTSTNYRSSRHIIEFNNRLFEYIRQRYSAYPAVADSYQDVRQAMPADVDQKKVPGYVRIHLGNYKGLLQDPVIQAAAAVVTGGDSDKKTEEPARNGKKKKEKDTVDVLTVLPGYLLKLHERYDWGDIGILVNTRSHGNKIVQCILDYNRATTGETIDIISGESLLLSNSPAVRRIIAMLRLIDVSQYGEDEDDAAAETREVRRFERKRRSDQRLYAVLGDFVKRAGASSDSSPIDNGKALEQCLSSHPASGGGDQSISNADLLSRLLPTGKELTTLTSIVESIIAYFKSEADASTDVDKETAFLLAFQDTVMQFVSMRNGGSVREFLKYWDENKSSLAVSSPAKGDSVNIMTIHKAKGLEFDCVVIPYANWQLDDNSQEKQYWMPREAFAGTVQALPPGVEPCDSALVPPIVRVNKSALVGLCDSGALGDEAAAFVMEQRSATIIDNLNKTYVAMTRPCTELHLFGEGVKDNDLKPLMQDFVIESGLFNPIVGDDGEASQWFEYGELSSREQLAAKRKRPAPSGQTLSLSQYPIHDIPLDIKVRVDQASSPHIKAGVRLHGLLSRIHDRNDVERVVAQGLKHGVITRDGDDPCGIDSINAHVVKPIMAPDGPVAEWFDPANKVYSERTITMASGSLWDADGIENLRPDRIVRRPDGQLLVIDYKSGQRDDKRYRRQLRRYMDRLRLIFPGAPIAGRIWYILDDSILNCE